MTHWAQSRHVIHATYAKKRQPNRGEYCTKAPRCWEKENGGDVDGDDDGCEEDDDGKK